MVRERMEKVMRLDEYFQGFQLLILYLQVILSETKASAKQDMR